MSIKTIQGIEQLFFKQCLFSFCTTIHSFRNKETFLFLQIKQSNETFVCRVTPEKILQNKVTSVSHSIDHEQGKELEDYFYFALQSFRNVHCSDLLRTTEKYIFWCNCIALTEAFENVSLYHSIQFTENLFYLKYTS